MKECKKEINISDGRTSKAWVKVLSCGLINFNSTINGNKLEKIIDGNNMKEFFPNGEYRDIQTISGGREDYIEFMLSDDSQVIIKPDYDRNSILFDFKAIDKDVLDSLKNSVLSFIDL